MRTLALQLSVTAVLDGTGSAIAQAGPASPGETWFPAVVAVAAAETSITDEAQCAVSAGAYPGQYLAGTTLSGSTGDSTDSIAGQVIHPGQYVFAAWTGGDPNATVTMTVSGTRTVP